MLKGSFSRSDFECKCGCGEAKFDERLYCFLLKLSDLKLDIKRISSAFRCEKHNAETPGSSKTSNHCLGRAVDINFNVSDKALLSHVCQVASGLNLRCLFYDWGLHIDLGKSGRDLLDVIPLLT